MKRKICLLLTLATLTTGCANAAAAADRITVISREEGSGTRGAFIELFGIEQKNDTGEKVDHTTEKAEVTNSTSVMMATVAGNKNAIGYISLGSLNDTVKAVSIDGVLPSVDTVKSGEYKIARPFNIAYQNTLSHIGQDFIQFILSDEGQAVIEEKGYIGSAAGNKYASANLSGKLTVAGSSSVAPVMETLKEHYITRNPDVEIEVQQNDSTTGITSVIDGVCDIGMASRALKDSELASGLTAQVIATDGIAVIVHLDNPVSALTTAQVKEVYLGERANWDGLS